MSVRTGLLCIFLLSCVAQDPSDPFISDEPALATTSAAITLIDYPSYPTPTFPRYAETWESSRSTPLSWPSDTARVQVIIRRGHAATLFSPATFYAFIVSDGTRLRRILLVPNSDYSNFRAHLNSVFTAAETPGSERSHSIAGSTYVGPHPVGPPGDPVPLTYIDRVLTSAAAIDDAAQQAVNTSF